MENGNKTSLRECRFLSEDHFDKVYEAFIEAFSDYVIPFALTEIQFRNHINLNAVDLKQTPGYFENDRLIGFSLNGFGDWDGKPTIYDAGTGVIPSFRRQGISEKIFDQMLPHFRSRGFEQCLLEVVTKNVGAVSLYRKLGFTVIRELALLQCDSGCGDFESAATDVELNEIDEPDWNLLRTFWDVTPSWQNSIEAVNRSRKMKRIVGAFLNGKCVGYVVFSSKFGRVAQLAVDKSYRSRGIGSALINILQAQTAEGFSLQIINVDKSLTEAMKFFKNRGFYERLSQYEMVKAL